MVRKKKSLLARLKAWFTPPRRKVIYAIGVAIAGSLATYGYLNDQQVNLISSILAIILGMAYGNVKPAEPPVGEEPDQIS